MDPSAYDQLLTQQGSALQGASMVPYLGSSHCACPKGQCRCGSLGASNATSFGTTKTNPTPYLQRGGSIMAVSGLLILGGFFARTRDMTLPSQVMLGSGAIMAGYGVARLT